MSATSIFDPELRDYRDPAGEGVYDKVASIGMFEHVGLVNLPTYFATVAYPVVSRPTGQHIEYVSPHFFAMVAMALYLLSTSVSLVLSTHRIVKVFGVLALLSFGAAYYFYAVWFISVWCLFAALMSAVIYLHFALRWPGRVLPRHRPATAGSGRSTGM